MLASSTGASCGLSSITSSVTVLSGNSSLSSLATNFEYAKYPTTKHKITINTAIPIFIIFELSFIGLSFCGLSSFVCLSVIFLGASVFVSTFMLLISKFLIGSIFKKLFDEVSSLFSAIFPSSILIFSKSLKSSFI